MQNLRDYIKSTPLLWVACLLPALLLMLSMQLHIHVQADHQHDAEVQQHNHDLNLHKAHLGNSHDTAHGSNLHHPDSNIIAIDISPEGLNKTFTLMLLACALISTVILLLSPHTQGFVLKRNNEKSPHIRWRTALPPQLRAPPL